MPKNRKYDREALYRLWELSKESMSMDEVAAAVGLDRKQLDNAIHRARAEYIAPVWFDVDIGEPWRLEGDFMVVGDVHVPTTDYEFAMRTVRIAERHMVEPRRLIIAGDLFNFDGFSSYLQITQAPSWKQEREAAKHLIERWLETFSKIYWIMGNHDRRIQKWLKGEFDNDDLLSLINEHGDRFKASNYGWCVVDTPTGEWRVTHAKNYSVNQLNVADALANKHRQNIINHHEHHTAIGWDRYKKNVVINNGGLFDVKKMAYVRLDDSKNAGMTKGFTMLRGGYPDVFGEPPFTNWSVWLDD